MTKEFNTFLAHGTWELMALCTTKRAFLCKWEFWVKLKVDGSLKRYKASLIAKGYIQIEAFNYGVTFSLVIKSITILIVPSLALSKG